MARFVRHSLRRNSLVQRNSASGGQPQSVPRRRHGKQPQSHILCRPLPPRHRSGRIAGWLRRRFGVKAKAARNGTIKLSRTEGTEQQRKISVLSGAHSVYSFIPARAVPSINCFWKIKKSSIIGTTAITAPAI